MTDESCVKLALSDVTFANEDGSPYPLEALSLRRHGRFRYTQPPSTSQKQTVQ